MRVLSFVLTLSSLAGCSNASASSDAATPSDAPTVDAFTADASGLDAGPSDAAAGPDANVPRSDAGCPDRSAACAHPPAGFIHCGGGAIDPTAAATACTTVNPPLDLHMGLPKACSAFTIGSAHYDAWCGAGAVYVWVSFDVLTSSNVNDCGFDVPLPDGGSFHGNSYRLQWGLRDTNDRIYASVTTSAGRSGGMLAIASYPYLSTDMTRNPSQWTGSFAADGPLAVPIGATNGTATLYFTAAQTNCRGVPTSAGFQIVLAAPITWMM